VKRPEEEKAKKQEEDDLKAEDPAIASVQQKSDFYDKNIKSADDNGDRNLESWKGAGGKGQDVKWDGNERTN